jgi:hypothetical protein
MSGAEFERRIATSTTPEEPADPAASTPATLPISSSEIDNSALSRAASTTSTTRSRAPRGKPVKPRRVQRMFAIEEDLDKKLWLYAIHLGKDRSEVVNDLLRPIVASMVLYDSRDRRSARAAETETDSPRSEAEAI